MGPPQGRYWAIKKEKLLAFDRDNRVWWGEGRNNIPALKKFLNEVKKGRVPQTLWFYSDVGHTQDAKKALLDLGVIKSQDDATMTPKPVALIERILEIATQSDSVVLDSFAGSATTAHAVLSTNAKDEGTRQFILIESEEYADRITAERVRRVIGGYAFEGNRREDLLREKLTWSKFQKADEYLKKIDVIRSREGFSDGNDLAHAVERRFDKLNVKVEDGELVVEGEKRISERVEGLGGEFTFASLGESIDPEGILSGKTLPDYENLGAWLFYTATGGTLNKRKVKAKDWYLGEAQNRHLWLVYKPDLGFLKSAEAALTLSLAKKLREKYPRKGHLVFAPAKFLSNKQLLEHGVEYAPLPFALYREA